MNYLQPKTIKETIRRIGESSQEPPVSKAHMITLLEGHQEAVRAYLGIQGDNYWYALGRWLIRPEAKMEIEMIVREYELDNASIVDVAEALGAVVQTLSQKEIRELGYADD